MGTSSSREQSAGAPPEQQEEESLAASTGSLPMLRDVFSRLSSSPTGAQAVPEKSLEETFCLSFVELQSESSPIPECFPRLLNNLGVSIVESLFKTDDKVVCWVSFLKGYNRCCGRMSVSSSLNILYRIYFAASKILGYPVDLEFDSEDNCGKIAGSFKLNDVLMLLWMCWIMQLISRMPIKRESILVLPDITHLITSAYLFCSDDDSKIGYIDIFDLEKNISAQKVNLWILSTLPGLADCVAHYIRAKLQSHTDSEVESEPSTASPENASSVDIHDSYLLTCGRAWAISLALRNTAHELTEACFPRSSIGRLDNLLYRSSLHGKGLSRFWSNVEGYYGPVLILLSVKAASTSEDGNGSKQSILAVLTGQGFENRDIYFGSSGYLFTLSPVFKAFSAFGKDKNFVYCHLRPTGRVYEPKPMPVGIAFGGTVGNERIFIDEDFTRMTIRHHAVDKTYQPGFLLPNQGFLPIDVPIVDVEVWGLGGKIVKQKQDAYKKRESLFSEQRRKVDLKTFGTWEDSPEKMMMDMVSDPNRVQREDR